MTAIASSRRATIAELGARVARAAAERNAARMRAALHRAPTAGDLYIAHVFGAGTAISLLKAAGEAPDTALQHRYSPTLAANAAEVARGAKAPSHRGTVLSPPRRRAARASAPHRHRPAADALPNSPPEDRRPRQTTAPKTIAWQAEVSVAKADRRAQ